MSSLFTIVEAAQAKLREDNSLADGTPLSPDRVAELPDMCLRSSYGGVFYEQREGTTMGSGSHHGIFLGACFWVSTIWLWKQYVVDTFCIFRKGDVDGLLRNNTNEMGGGAQITV